MQLYDWMAQAKHDAKGCLLYTSNYNSACAREDDAFLSDFDDIEVYYRQNINYSPTQRETQAISKWLSQTCKAGVMYAIDEAVDRGARNKSYISAVVDNLERNNVKTQADLTQFVERRRKRIQEMCIRDRYTRKIAHSAATL